MSQKEIEEKIKLYLDKKAKINVARKAVEKKVHLNTLTDEESDVLMQDKRSDAGYARLAAVIIESGCKAGDKNFFESEWFRMLSMGNMDGEALYKQIEKNKFEYGRWDVPPTQEERDRCRLRMEKKREKAAKKVKKIGFVSKV